MTGDDQSGVMESITIECENIGYVAKRKELFKGITFRLALGKGGLLLAEGQELSLMLLKICAALAEPTTGRVTWFGHTLEERSRRQVLELRRNLGWVHRGTRLVSNMSLRDNIVLGMIYERNITFEQGYDEVQDRLKRFGLEHIAHLRPDDVSYPQRRMALYLREIVKKPKLYLLDAPAHDLGEDFEIVMGEVKEAVERQESSFLVTDTTAWLGLRWVDWVLVMNESGAEMHQAEGFDLLKHDPH